jgi:hypothetical protein
MFSSLLFFFNSSHTVLGAISAMGVVNIELRVPQAQKKKKKAQIELVFNALHAVLI